MDERTTFKIGKTVKKGNVIGRVGMTGATSKYHLHLQIRNAQKNIINPRTYSSDLKNIESKDNYSKTHNIYDNDNKH